MKNLKEFIIQFEGLSLGNHEYSYCLEEPFFTFFELSESIIKGKVNVSLQLTKHSNMLMLQFYFKGIITTTCDRCLEPIDIKIVGEPKLIVKFGETEEETDEIIVLPLGEKELDISKFLFETVYLLIPPRNVHKENECNPEVISKLKRLLVKEKSKENPQWDILKKLKNK